MLSFKKSGSQYKKCIESRKSTKTMKPRPTLVVFELYSLILSPFFFNSIIFLHHLIAILYLINNQSTNYYIISSIIKNLIRYRVKLLLLRKNELLSKSFNFETFLVESGKSIWSGRAAQFSFLFLFFRFFIFISRLTLGIVSSEGGP